ncbi:hypothetical protein BDP27DRAFT_1424725 [Rhodocollybia butyracea]|uniref:Uncharacterized protein n=1 Tax=Rhodocollybia butyracea TaxID=206335 RepID=A0A9P5PLS9_9AGAR|nr:hypothetical protein BDP27DRAFT_1424725 [Rhodocollybia butyracea]
MTVSPNTVSGDEGEAEALHPCLGQPAALQLPRTTPLACRPGLHLMTLPTGIGTPVAPILLLHPTACARLYLLQLWRTLLLLLPFLQLVVLIVGVVAPVITWAQ